jgi:hypothetical protein
LASGPSAASDVTASSRPPSAGSAGLTPDIDGHTKLRQRRDALAEEVTELHWDLGGLAYEMAIRDHFRLDVLVRRAALLQERDAELAEVERLLAMEDTATIGDCPQCGAPHSRGAVFCWQCGIALMERSAPARADLGSADADAASMASHDTIGGHAPTAGASATSSGTVAARPSASDAAADDATAVMDRLLAPSASPRAGAPSSAGAHSPTASTSGSRPSPPPSSTPDR